MIYTIIILSSILLYCFLSVFLKRRPLGKGKTLLAFGAIFAAHGVLAAVFTDDAPVSALKIFFAFAFDALFCLCLFEGGIGYSVIYTGLYYFMSASVEAVIGTVFGLAELVDLTDLAHESLALMFVSSICMRSAEGVLILLIRTIRNRGRVKADWRILLGLPIFSMIFIVMVYLLFWRQDNRDTQIVLMVFGIFIIVQNIIVIIYISMIHAGTNRYRQVQEALEQQKTYFSDMIADYRAERKIAHDMRNHFITLSAALNEGNVESAKSYLAEIDSTLKGFLPERITGNTDIDALLYFKTAAAAQQGIRLIIRGDIPPSLDISPVDLNAVLGNAIDNALRGLDRRLDDKVVVELTFKRPRLTIRVQNSYDGNLRVKRDGALATTKETGGGYGMEIIDQIVRKYKGYMFSKHDDHLFSLTMVLHTSD